MKSLLYNKQTLSFRFKTITSGIIISLTVFSLQAQDRKRTKVHIGLVYPVSSNGSKAGLDTNNLSLNLIAGLSAAEEGVAVAGLSNIVRDHSKGILVAGLSNHIRNRAEGTTVSGFLNTYGSGKGVAVAGFTNISGDMKGAQVAGFANLSKDMEGFQLAGFMNKSGNTSTQISGFMNIAKKVKGTQISAFINVADSSDYPIGFLNLIKNGEKSISAGIDDNQTLLLSFRSGGKFLYGILGLGYNVKNDKEVYAFEAGLGAHLLHYNTFRLNLELASTGLTRFKSEGTFKSSIRVLPAWRVSSHIELFGGPSLNLINADSEEGRDMVHSYMRRWDSSNSNRFTGLYLGYIAGVQVLF
ncbi:hypothetical protein [Pedobacter sp.]|jgi:hypothetical protein|uniref:hypothetical protein n=1 Tax=Pedobacter sp. TaxID=1411316 RepID=UPI002C2D93B6|nr:hypothetical protein [Pedobacter sp.]HWW43275.1 hypothetical protein [Pedobacter sp.]